MDFTRLEKNIIDNITEAQLKIGYDNRPMSLNYTLSSLCHLTGCVCDSDRMGEYLAEFDSEKIGKITARPIKNGYCITISTEGTKYVSENYGKTGFLAELIETVRQHGKGIKDVISVFGKYSDNVVIEKSNSEEFDYLVFFADGNPDDYYYCLTDEGCHVTYHRFIKEDYEDFDF